MHPLGVSYGSKGSCGQCVWARNAGPGPKVLRCVAANNQRIQKEWNSCIYFEAKLDCLDCGACCGPAFDAVEVSQRDPVRKKHPDLIIRKEGRFCVPRREGNFCSQLQADNRCQIYTDRPQCCREFTRGSYNCLFARQRVGRSGFWNA